MEDFFVFLASLFLLFRPVFCYFSFLAWEKWLGEMPTWIGGLLESPGSHSTRRKLNIPAMLMRRADKAYPLKLWSFRIRVEDGREGNSALNTHRRTKDPTGKGKTRWISQVFGKLTRRLVCLSVGLVNSSGAH
jgi:hypothetical protein